MMDDLPERVLAALEKYGGWQGALEALHDAERYRYVRRHMDPRTPPLWVGCAGSEEFSRHNDDAIDAAMNGANA